MEVALSEMVRVLLVTVGCVTLIARPLLLRVIEAPVADVPVPANFVVFALGKALDVMLLVLEVYCKSCVI